MNALDVSAESTESKTNHMPDMDGYQATQAIRALEGKRPGPRTRIIALTANAMDGDRKACLQAGMDDYIAKPVTPQALKALLERNLSQVGAAAGQAIRDDQALP